VAKRIRVTSLESLQRQGIRRVGTPKSGFRYVAAGGKRLANGAVERIHDLKLPPAWTEVYVSPQPGSKLQAIGKDKAGRWQYRYHPAYRQRQENAKYRRLLRFAEALPRMRAAIDRDLRKKGLARERVMAAIVHVIATCFMRAGSQQYADRNKSYGVATIKAKHVEVEGDLVRFDYPGKSGKRQLRELRDARIARVVKECLRVRGPDLFKYVDDDGQVVDVRRRHVNAYIKDVMGGPFTAKDFRTWAGTLICACELARHGAEIVPGRTDKKRMVTAAVKATSALLGNTPAVCKSSYIFPAIIEGFSKGKVIEKYFDTVEELARQKGLHGAEQALVEFLGASAGSPGAAAKRLARRPRGATLH
jgi:DNA topoisomerase-1